MSIEIKGADVLSGKLKDLATLKDVKQAIRVNTTELQNQAMRNTSVFTNPTGNLKRMIVIDFLDGGFTGKVTASADYSGYPEYGTRFMSARPYFRPALKQQEAKFKRDMGRLLK